MIVTEEEAKSLRCCGPEGCGFIVAAMTGGDVPLLGADGRDTGKLAYVREGQGVRMCVGAACMAWRWARNLIPPEDGKDRGYCGYAGG